MTKTFEKNKTRYASGESTASTGSNYIPVPPDGGYGWVIVVASFLNHIITDGIMFTFGVFFIEFDTYFNEGSGKTALIGSLLAGFYFLSGPIASGFINKFGCRSVVIAGAIMASLSFIACMFSPNLNILLLTYGILGGTGLGLVYVPSIISVTFYFHRKRALATGIACCGAGVGTFIFAPLGQLLLNEYGWKNAMLIIAGIVLNACLFGMLMRPLVPTKSHKPRRKNLLDRLKEQAAKLSSGKSPSGDGDSDDDGVNAKSEKSEQLRKAQRVHDERLARTRGDSLCESQNAIGQRSRSNTLGEVPVMVMDADGHLLTQDATGLTGSNPRVLNTIPSVVVDEESNMEKELLANEDRVTPSKNNNWLQEGPSPAQTTSVGLKGGKASLLGVRVVDPRAKSTSYSDLWMKKYGKNIQKLQPSAVSATKEDYARPLYRKDIFYSGSLLHIPQFRSTPDIKSFVKSVTSIPGVDQEAGSGIVASKLCRCLPKSFVDVIRNMLDFTLLCDPIFLMVAIGNAFGMFGLFLPFTFMADRAMVLGVSKSQAAFLLSIVGITNTIGRVLSGALADVQCINSLVLHNMSLLVMGASCIFNMFCLTYPLMCLSAAVFGFGMATFISLTSVILVDLLGLEKMTNAFGLLTMIRGIFVISGPPIAGMIYQQTNDFDITFHIGGVVFICAGFAFLCLHLPCLVRRRASNLIQDDVIQAELTLEEK